MRNVVLAVFFGFSLIAGGSSHTLTVMRPDKYIKLTAFSQRILLIDIKEVKSRVTKTEGGLESREVTVIGSEVEAIRGKGVGKEFMDKIMRPELLTERRQIIHNRLILSKF